MQRALLARRLDAHAAEADPTSGTAQLVAYVAGAHPPSPSDVRSFLKDRMPDFMVPSTVVVLEDLPRTPNGKVDRNALPAPGTETSYDVGVAPRNAVEERLARIWGDVLGVERIGVYDNFFEVGGDSITSIQIISRANQAGLRLKPGQFFEHPTIAALASVAGTTDAEAVASPAPAGPVALTPIQRWFFEQALPTPGHWNQSLSLDLAPATDIARLETALRHVAAAHDAFRLRFRQEGEGWTQRLADQDAERIVIAHHDLSPETERDAATETVWATSQAGFDLGTGPLLRADVIDRGPSALRHLILTAHHLVIDVVSWQTFLGDVETVYAHLGDSKTPQPTPSGTRFDQWMEALGREVRSSALAAERAYWHDQVAPSALPASGEGMNTEGEAETIIVRLSPEETQALTDATTAYGMKVHELILTALAATLTAQAGTNGVAIDFESHGRVEIDEALDVTRTVGWFTTVYPVRLDPGTLSDPRTALTRTKEQLRAVPRQGIGYGILRYLGEATDRAHLADGAEILFNYMGRAYPDFDDTSPLRGPVELRGSHDPKGARDHRVEINALIESDALVVRWTYSSALDTVTTVERLAAETQSALQALVAHCLDPDAGAYTPSDFPDIDLSQDDLDALLGDL